MPLYTPSTNWKNKKVLIMGLGTKSGGVQSALFAAKHGANLTITDTQSTQALTKSIDKLKMIKPHYELGGHHKKSFIDAEIIIKNAGIKYSHPLLQLAKQNGAIIDTPIGIFSELVERPYIGITGTKGKSFTTTLTAQILNQSVGNSVAAGNNCVSPLQYLKFPQPNFILELSSWQLAELGRHKRSPHISCWLNFFPDHMNYYSNKNEYFEDKANIFRYQNNNHIAILPMDIPEINTIVTKAKRLYFSATQPVPAGCYIQDDILFFVLHNIKEKIIECKKLPIQLQPPHFRPLIAAACCCALAHTHDVAATQRALLDFLPPAHRFEYIFSTKKIRIINDSAASTPHSVAAAIDAVQQSPLILITGGGGDKNLDYSIVKKPILQKVSKLILFKNEPTSKKMLSLLPSKYKKKIFFADNLEQATEYGHILLNKTGQGTLLFSPGCSGQPLFPDLFVRGEIFKNYIKEYTNQQKAE